ncbi:MAG: TraB/GumN family protein [Thermoplasmata archaeon]|nr:TraB/GumN family protein [Thermoplasmata archaeon]
MITIVGTGHVFNLAEPVSFIVKNTWPDAVLLELDVGRLNAITAAADNAEPKGDAPEMSPIYAQTAKYQQRMSEEHGAQLGSEFIAAINTARLAGAEIIPIDTDAMRVMDEMWSEMSFGEKVRYRLSGISDSIGGKKKVAEVQKSFAEDEEAYIEGMRRRYPTLVRKLIDERNQHMADQINEHSKRFSNMVVIVGDAHVEGICKLLDEEDVRKIRLADLMDRERMDRVRDMVWKGDVQE